MGVQLCFVDSPEPVFSSFLNLFQKEELLIHIFHNQLSEHMCILMLHFLKAEAVGDKTGGKLLSIDVSKPEKQLPDARLNLGESTPSALVKMKAKQLKVPIMEMSSPQSIWPAGSLLKRNPWRPGITTSTATEGWAGGSGYWKNCLENFTGHLPERDW